jgi:hypothetical protein
MGASTYHGEDANGVQAHDGRDAREGPECEDGEECGFFAHWALDAEKEGDGEGEDEYVD